MEGKREVCPPPRWFIIRIQKSSNIMAKKALKLDGALFFTRKSAPFAIDAEQAAMDRRRTHKIICRVCVEPKNVAHRYKQTGRFLTLMRILAL